MSDLAIIISLVVAFLSGVFTGMTIGEWRGCDE